MPTLSLQNDDDRRPVLALPTSRDSSPAIMWQSRTRHGRTLNNMCRGGLDHDHLSSNWKPSTYGHSVVQGHVTSSGGTRPALDLLQRTVDHAGIRELNGSGVAKYNTSSLNAAP